MVLLLSLEQNSRTEKDDEVSPACEEPDVGLVSCMFWIIELLLPR